MAGSISLSLSQQFDSTGAPLNGGLLYFYAAGTTTPQSAYQDSSLTILWPNPIVLDSAGRIPPFYLADGQIKVRLTNAAGVTQVSADNLLVVGASSGSGSAPSVDATTILATGDFKLRYGTGALTGFVRANGRTIGSASSGASERANADCQPLFEYLWGADANLTVSTGRGASANADWVANKTIALPDARGLGLSGLDDMGNSARGVFTGITAFSAGGSATTLGTSVGQARRTLDLTNVPAGITSSGTASVGPGPTLTTIYGNGAISNISTTGGGSPVPNSGSLSNSALTGTASVTSTNTGGQAFDTISPTLLLTIYQKL